MDLYNALWGRVSPGCVPTQGVSTSVLHVTNYQAFR
jgi:hypothetical protein